MPLTKLGHLGEAGFATKDEKKIIHVDVDVDVDVAGIRKKLELEDCNTRASEPRASQGIPEGRMCQRIIIDKTKIIAIRIIIISIY